MTASRIMKNGRNQRDVLSIERTLGLKSERGISRQSNKEAPPIEAALKGIKLIQTAYVHKSLDEIRDSQPLKDDATRLFNKYAPQIWPGPENGLPAWLEEPSETRSDGRYPKSLHYTDIHDRETLRDAFIELIIEKCINYHENQLQKSRRQTAKQLNQQLQQDTFDEPGTQLEENIYVQSEQSIYKEDEPDQDSGIGASPLEQSRLSDKSRAFHEQFAAYTSPVPLIPHGLPSAGGVYARPPSSRSSAVSYHQTSQKRLPGQAPPQGRSKRARVIREDGTRADSLVIRLRVSHRQLSRLASIGTCWPRTEVTSRRVEPDTIAVGTQTAGTHPLPNPSPYLSPYRQTLPWNGIRNDQSGGPPRNTVHVDLTSDEEQPPQLMSDVREILGDFADCTVARELLANYPNMSRNRLENLQSVLVEFPDTRDDIFLLEKRIRALATGPRVLPIAQRRASSVSPASRPDFRAKTPAVERTAKLAEEILGPLCACSAAAQVLDSYPLMSREQLEVLRSTFTNYPETQNDFPLLQKIVRFEAFDVVTGATAFPRKRSVDGQLKQALPTVEPKREDSAEIKKERLTSRSLNNITVEINWGRDTEYEYTDHMDLQEFDSGAELFQQIESYLPDELRSSGRIKEVQVKCKTDLHGGNIPPRIARDESRGKAAVRQLIKKLRAQPSEMEIELAFLVLWETAV
ncbi:hypothetical protein HII31_06607 [Pseudocercospora fuligena]|uniref:DUF7071 domain-containing protein n=1 Tax=Pseudocercospora fuligena TaxID=685502 RepID=A0A8H6RJZ7_9PEZI|nr:hypothetical protein HII31_06607 [Pseudocercospora fuligena]